MLSFSHTPSNFKQILLPLLSPKLLTGGGLGVSCDIPAIQGNEAMKGKSLWETGSAQISHAQRIYKREQEKSGGTVRTQKVASWQQDIISWLNSFLYLEMLKVHFRHYTKSLSSFCGLTRVFLFFICLVTIGNNQQRKLFVQKEARKDYAQHAMKCLQDTHWEYKQILPYVFQQQGS